MRGAFEVGVANFGFRVDRGLQLAEFPLERCQLCLLIDQHSAQLFEVVLHVHQQRLDLYEPRLVAVFTRHYRSPSASRRIV